MRGKRLTIEQCKWLQAYGLHDDPRKRYLAQKNTPTLLQLRDIKTGEIIRFTKIVSGGRVSLERSNGMDNRKYEKDLCLYCDCYDEDLGCTMPSVDRGYACPLEGDVEHE